MYCAHLETVRSVLCSRVWRLRCLDQCRNSLVTAWKGAETGAPTSPKNRAQRLSPASPDVRDQPPHPFPGVLLSCAPHQLCSQQTAGRRGSSKRVLRKVLWWRGLSPAPCAAAGERAPTSPCEAEIGSPSYYGISVLSSSSLARIRPWVHPRCKGGVLKRQGLKRDGVA